MVSAEARGFVLGRRWRWRPARASSSPASPGKLPREVSSVEYQLEYGVDALEVHSDAIRAARACSCTTTCSPRAARPALCGLVEQAGGVVAGCAFVIELAFLNGRERLRDYDVRSLVVFDDE